MVGCVFYRQLLLLTGKKFNPNLKSSAKLVLIQLVAALQVRVQHGSSVHHLYMVEMAKEVRNIATTTRD
jgi:hypothetical protein